MSKTDEIAGRLRNWVTTDDRCHLCPRDDDVIALLDERDRLRAALEPFAREADRYEPDEGDDRDRMWDTDGCTLRIGDLRRARAALEGKP